MSLLEWTKREVEIACKRGKRENSTTVVLAMKVH